MAYNSSSVCPRLREKHEKQDKFSKYDTEELKSYIRRQKELRRLRVLQEYEERARLLESKQQRLKELDQKCKQIAHKKQQKRNEARYSYPTSKSVGDPKEYLHRENGALLQSDSKHALRQHFDSKSTGFEDVGDTNLRRKSSKRELDTKPVKSASKLEKEAANFIFKEFENIVRRECKNLLRTRSAQFGSRSQSSCSLQSEVKDEDEYSRKPATSRSKPEKVPTEDKNVGTSFSLYNYMESRSENGIDVHHGKAIGGYQLCTGRSLSCASVSEGVRPRLSSQNLHSVLPQSFDFELGPYFANDLTKLDKISERKKHEAAMKIQAAYKSYRMRKMIAEAKVRSQKSRVFDQNYLQEVANKLNGMLQPSKDSWISSAAPKHQTTNGYGTTPTRNFVADHISSSMSRSRQHVTAKKSSETVTHIPQPRQKIRQEQLPIHIKPTRLTSRTMNDTSNPPSSTSKSNDIIPGYIPPPPEIGLISRPVITAPRTLPMMRMKQVDEPFPKHLEGHSFSGNQRPDFVSSSPSPLKLISSISKFQLPHSLKSSHGKDEKSPRIEELVKSQYNSNTDKTDASQSRARTPLQSQAESFRETLLHLRKMKHQPANVTSIPSAKKIPSSYSHVLDLPDPAFAMVLQEKLRLMREQAEVKPPIFTTPVVPSPVRKSQMIAVSKATEQIKLKIVEAKQILEDYKNELLRCNDFSVMSNVEDPTYESDFDTEMPSQSLSNQVVTGLRSESEVAQIRSEESLIRTKSSKTVSPRKPQVAVKPTTSQSSTEAPRTQEIQPIVRSRKSTSPSRSASNAAYLTSLQSRKPDSVIETSARRSLHVPTDVNTGTNVLPVASVKPGDRKISKNLRELRQPSMREKGRSPTSVTDRTEDGVDEVDQDADSMSTSSKELLEESETDYEDIVPSASKASGNVQTEDINYDTDFDSDLPSSSVSKPPVSITMHKKDTVPSILEDDEIKEDFIASEPASQSQEIESKKTTSVHHLPSIQESVSRSTVDQSSQVMLNELSEAVSEAPQKSMQSTADKNVQSDLQETNDIVDDHISYASEFDTDVPSTSKKLLTENLPAEESESIQVDMQESVKDSTIREEIYGDGSVEESIAYEVSESMKQSPPLKAEVQTSRVSQEKPTTAAKKDMPVLKPEDLNLSNVTDSSAVSDISTPKDIDNILEMILADDSSEAEDMEDKVLESAISDVLDKEKPRDAVQDVTDISPLGYTPLAESQSQKDHNWLTPMHDIQHTDFPVVTSVSEVTDAEEDWLSKQSVLENTVDKSLSSSLVQMKQPAHNSEPIGAGGDQDDMSDDEYVEEFLSCKTILGSKSTGFAEFEATHGNESTNQDLLTHREPNLPEKALVYEDQDCKQQDLRLKEDMFLPQPMQSAEENASCSSSVSSPSHEKVEEVVEAPKTTESLDLGSSDRCGEAHEEDILEIAKTVDADIVEKIESLIVDEISKHIDGDSADSEHSQATEVGDSKYSLNSRASNFYVEEVVYESDFDSEMVSEKSEQSKQKSISESAASSRRSSKLEAVVKDEVERFVTDERAKFAEKQVDGPKSTAGAETEAHDDSSSLTFDLRLQNTIEKKEVIDSLITRILRRIFSEAVAADKQAAVDTDSLKQKFADAVNSIECLSPIPKVAPEDEAESVPEEIDACAEWFEDDLLTPGQEMEEESLKLEAAKIVAEQQRIENEIRALEALQAQVPSSLLGLPELPDKPPPPYSPPSAESVALVPEPYTIQCTAEELEEKVVKIVHKFWDTWQAEGKCIAAQALEDESQDLAAVNEENPECNDSSRQADDVTSTNHMSPSEISSRAFNTFLQDLILDTVKEIMFIEDFNSPTSKSYLDRIRPGSLALEAAKLRVPRTKEALISSTLKRITNLLPYPLLASYVPVQRKRLTKWTSRPRDLVDEVLAEELIEEDREWTESWPEEILVLDRWTDKFTRRALFDVLTICKTVFS